MSDSDSYPWNRAELLEKARLGVDASEELRGVFAKLAGALKVDVDQEMILEVVDQLDLALDEIREDIDTLGLMAARGSEREPPERAKLVDEFQVGQHLAAEVEASFRELLAAVRRGETHRAIYNACVEVETGLRVLLGRLRSTRVALEVAKEPPEQHLVHLALDRIVAELTIYLPAELATERGRKIVEVLSEEARDDEAVEKVVIELLENETADLPFAERVLTVTRTRDAWLNATRKGDEG